MTQEEWKSLLRESKNDGDYFNLITCLKGLIGYSKKVYSRPLSFDEVVNWYSKKDLRGWYKDKYTFSLWFDRIYNRVI